MELGAVKSFRGCDPSNNEIKHVEIIHPLLDLSPPLLLRSFTELKKMCNTCYLLRTVKEFHNPIECFSCYNDKLRNKLRNKKY